MLIGLLVTAAVVGAVVVVWKMSSARHAPPRKTLLPTDDAPIPPEWMIGREISPPIRTRLARPSALAVGPGGMVRTTSAPKSPGGRVYIGDAGAKQVRVFDATGAKLADIKTGGAPLALAAAEDGSLYVALRDRVEVYDAAGRRQAAWASAGAGSLFTAIAVSKTDVFVANVIQRRGRVLRYRRSDGKLLQTLDGVVQGDKQNTGFVVPSPYFDLAIGVKGRLWVVNPGRRRIEAYQSDCGPAVTAKGKPLRWGRSGKGLEDFCGCCNPVHIAILPDGSFVTAEKGLTRVKLYDKTTKFVGVLAGPKEFDAHDRAVRGRGAGGADIRGLEVAADKAGRVYVLDSATKQVRIFEREIKPKAPPEGAGKTAARTRKGAVAGGRA